MKKTTAFFPYLTALFILLSLTKGYSQCVPVPDQNTVIGKVFTDQNGDGNWSGGPPENGIANVDINLYQDDNGNGVVDPSESIVDTATSDANGDYTLIPPEIIFEEDVKDRFNFRSFSNNNGSEDWEDDWEELGENDGPRFGNVTVTNALRFGRNSFLDDDITGDGADRVADLSTYTTATLSFRFRDFISFTSATYFSVDAQISTDGLTYVTLGTFNFGDIEQTYTYNIDAYISATTHIRFIGNGLIQNNRSNYLYFDNITIDYSKEGYFPTYVVEIDDSTIPSGESITTPSYSAVTFTDIGEISCDHNFGFLNCGGSCAPEAVDDIATLDQGGSVTLDVVSNDVAGNDNIDPLSVTIISQPSFGSATVAPTGEVIYAPYGNYFGADSFVYQVCDDNPSIPLCDNATVSLTIVENVIDACIQAAENKLYYIPFSDDELRTAFDNSDGTCGVGLGNDVRRVTSLKSPYPGVVITYDHWEDGYETDITDPQQSTTEVWGDNDPINGIAPGYPDDYIPSGGNFVLDNTYNYNPRNPADFYFDGKDKILASADIAVSTVAGDVGRFAVQAAKTDVYDSKKFGTSFRVPFGQELGNEFQYTALFIRSEEDNTIVNVDIDDDGIVDSTASLNEGEVHFIDGGVLSGSLVTSTKRVGVDLFFGALDCFGTRQINILPSIFYSSTYYTPVPTTNGAEPAVAFFYNYNNSAIIIDYEHNSGSGNINIPASSSASLLLSNNSAYKFTSQGGESYVASEVIDSGTNADDYDWAFNLIAEERLTDFGAIAWAPGSLDGSRNDNPVWVTPEANATIYIKFDGDLTSTTASMSPCGIPYDTSIAVNYLNYTRIYDTLNADNDQSGMALYTCDGTKIFAVYGEDPASALASTPSLDVGTSIQPLCLKPQIFANDDLAYGITDVSVDVPVLFNDSKFLTNIDPASVNTTGVIQPSNGSVAVNPDGSLTYVPNDGFIGEDTFEYTVCSLEYPSVCNTAEVKVKISDCPTPTNRNLVFGQVFLDSDGNGINDDGIGVEDITINVYEDLNANGVLDGGDIPLATSPTATSDALGNYSFEVPTYDRTITDDFSSGNYSGGTNWAGNWTESGESDGPTNGDLEVISGRLKVEDDKSIYREIDLADAAFATISFEVFEENDLDSNDEVKVEICSDNTFTNCQILYFSADDFTSASISGTVIEPDKLTATSHLRIEVDGYTSSDEEFFLDNVSIFAAIRGKNILVEMDSPTIPSIYTLSTDNVELATFPSGSTGNCEKANDFGLLGCSMTDPGLAVICNDSGTPMDSSDDTFTFTLNPDGLRFGSSYNVSGDVTGTGIYGAPVSFGPFPSTDFEKTITIVDDTGNCGLIDVKVNVSISQCLSTTVPTSVDFDGVNDYFEAPISNINTLDEYTLSFWVKPETLPTGGISDKTFVLGQKDMFEVTIGNNASAEPQIWAQHFYGAGPFSQDIGIPIDATNWNHFTYVVNYNTGKLNAFKNGVSQGTTDISGNPRLTNANPFRVGSSRDVQPDPGEENFEGWIDEIRIFSGSLTESQIQRLVYQEIVDNGGVVKGSLIDKNVVDIDSNGNIPWANLLTYYPMSDIVDGKVVDKSSFSNDARLYNITTLLPQSAPMPYETVADGTWNNENTWLHGEVWDIEDIANNKDWNIVNIKNNVTTVASHTNLGMIIDTGGSLAVSGENSITNNWYLQLDGTIDLEDDSQLLQSDKSDLVTGVNGKIIRRQEGNANLYWYNYWSSPVGNTAATTLGDDNGSINNPNNTPFNLNNLKDGSGSAMSFTNDLSPSAGEISREWLYTFANGVTYYNWVNINESTNINPGAGYTQKGTVLSGTEQQYTFEGRPNNGTIILDGIDNGGPGNVEDVSLTSYFVGNPYPSALDARQFITDNASTIGGTILLWEQWAGSSHYLADYEGGYGFITTLTTERAYQYPGIPIADQVQTQGIKKPTFYIPVGQGFFVEVANDGDIVFNNGQRVFIKESDVMPDQEDPNYANNGSSFMRNANQDSQASSDEATNAPQILRLEFGVSSGASRSFVIGFTANATDYFDYGLDGGLISNPPDDDMGTIINGDQYVIQAFAPYTSEKVVDVVFHASGNFTYTLNATEISNFPEDQDIFLIDNLTGLSHNLRDDNSYSFTSEPGNFNDRFDVVFQAPSTLSNEELIADNAIIYVNQPENKLYIKQLTDQAEELTIFNLLGQNIRIFNTITNQILENGVDISNISSGVYIVRLKTENDRTIDKKVIIN